MEVFESMIQIYLETTVLELAQIEKKEGHKRPFAKELDPEDS